MARMTTGVDVGSRSTVLLSGKPRGNTFALSEVRIEEHGELDLPERWETLGSDAKPRRTAIGLTGRNVNVRYTQVPRLPDWQLRNLMRFEVKEIGGQAGAEVASDFNVLPELPEIEGEDVVLLAMARESHLEEHLVGLDSIGGKLDHFCPNAVALYNAWLHYGVVEDDTVLLANIGHEYLDVAVVRGADLLFARNLSGGSALFDAALSERFGISLERAEGIKREMVDLTPGAGAGGGNQEKACRASQGPAAQVLDLLKSAILFCKSQIKLSGLRVDRLLLCGGGSRLKGLDAYLSAGLDMPVEKFDPFAVVDTKALDQESLEALDNFTTEAVVALGLATGAARDDAYKIEIVPERIQRSRDFWGGKLLLIAAGALALSFLSWRAFSESTKLESTRVEVSRMNSQLDRARRADAATAELADRNRELSELLRELWLDLGSGEQVARAIGAMGRAMPEDLWLVELNAREAAPANLGLEEGERLPVMHIEGRAREGTESPALVFEDFVQSMQRELASARMAPGLSPDFERFTLDLTLLGLVQSPADGSADSADSVEGEGR